MHPHYLGMYYAPLPLLPAAPGPPVPPFAAALGNDISLGLKRLDEDEGVEGAETLG